MAMATEVTGVWCNNCGDALVDARPDDPVDARKPCPACASLSRLVKVLVEEQVSMHSDLAIKKRRPGFRSGRRSRPAQEQWSGDDLSADGVWRHRERVVDRENNRYAEKVVDPDGTVIREVDEPLDEHLRHGSDKR